MPFELENVLRQTGTIPWVIILTAWELFWKGRGLWLAAQKKDKGWFIAMLIINTLGILPIVYLYYFSKKR